MWNYMHKMSTWLYRTSLQYITENIWCIRKKFMSNLLTPCFEETCVFHIYCTTSISTFCWSSYTNMIICWVGLIAELAKNVSCTTGFKFTVQALLLLSLLLLLLLLLLFSFIYKFISFLWLVRRYSNLYCDDHVQHVSIPEGFYWMKRGG